MKFSLGISPCPNDTFIFDAMLHGKIDTEGFEFDFVLEDVETLNKMAIEGKLDVSKVSYGVVPRLLETYALLGSGGALGRGVGPLFVSKKFTCFDVLPEDIRIALPGVNTTAHLLFSLAYPQLQHKIFLPFHEIEDAVLQGNADAGVIIHENRFTYQEKGLNKITDLGDVWEKRTGMPIPLGGIVAKKKWGKDLLKKLDGLIRKSLEYAFANSTVLPPFVCDHAQEMKPEVMRQHIDLYVNAFSLDLGEQGRAAVKSLLMSSPWLKENGAGMALDLFAAN